MGLKKLNSIVRGMAIDSISLDVVILFFKKYYLLVDYE